MEAGNRVITLDGSDWISGVYIIRVNSGISYATQKCVLVR
jgi:hypothetical protein